MKIRTSSVVGRIFILGITGIGLFSLIACQSVTSTDQQLEKIGAGLVVFEPQQTSTPTTSNLDEVRNISTLTQIPDDDHLVEMTSTPEVLLCSPLTLHPLYELPSIIGDPYKPPRPGREERHHGVDFGYYHYKDRDTMLGEPVQAILPGVVASAIEDRYPYGNMVMIETPRSELTEEIIELIQMAEGQSLYHLYAHLNLPPQITLGETVTTCQALGEVGMSGNTDIPHLHLETRIGPSGAVFERMRFYDTRATIEEMETYVLWRTSGEFNHFDPMTLLNYQDKP
jgi:murein DD-endopeptidase MepM/ murein hydrolase activator NlpD